MVTRCLQLYGTTSAASTDNLANLIIPDNGILTGLSMHIRPGGGASTDLAYELECSFRSTSQFQDNDVEGVIGRLCNGLELTGTGANVTQTSMNFLLNGIQIPVDAGEKIYLHTKSGSPAADFYACLFVAVKSILRR